MKTEDLTAAIARYDPLLADAVGKMVGYIKDRWAAPYPSKEQTEAVNATSVPSMRTVTAR